MSEPDARRHGRRNRTASGSSPLDNKAPSDHAADPRVRDDFRADSHLAACSSHVARYQALAGPRHDVGIMRGVAVELIRIPLSEFLAKIPCRRDI